MISEICRKVQERVAELEKEEASAEPAAVPSEDNRPALLILAEDHGMRCHPVLESKKLAECYRVECALLKEEDCDVASYEGVIAFTLTNEALGKIANGIFDTDYTRRFGTALLLADFLVAVFAFTFSIKTGLFSVLGWFSKSLVIDSVIESINKCKVFTIVCRDPDKITEFIMKDLNRSATIEEAVGAYTHDKRFVVTSIVGRSQAVRLRNFIRHIAPDSFITISNSSEIIGNGFRSHI